jgi:hypothetical protein
MAAQFRQQLLSLTSAGGRGYLIDRAVDPDPAFPVNPDPDPILIQGFDDQKQKKKNTGEQFLYIF